MAGPDSGPLAGAARQRSGWLWVVFILVLAGLVALDLVVAHHPHFGIDGTFGFGAWFGFASCVALVVLGQGAGSDPQAAGYLL